MKLHSHHRNLLQHEETVDECNVLKAVQFKRNYAVLSLGLKGSDFLDWSSRPAMHERSSEELPY